MAARLPDKPKDYSGYARFFSHTSFRKKLKRTASKAGRRVVYAALVLYYAATDKSIPLRQRAKIYGALGYFILPIDLIPDFTAILGYTDDLGALLWALKSIADNITPEAPRLRSGLRNGFPTTERIHRSFRCSITRMNRMKQSSSDIEFPANVVTLQKFLL